MKGFFHFYFFAFSLLIPGTGYSWSLYWIDGECSETKLACYTTVEFYPGRNCCVYPTSSKCLTQNRCRGRIFQHWLPRDFPIKWSLNPNKMVGLLSFTNLSEPVLVSLLKRAWDGWSSVRCTSFSHRYLGTTSIKPDAYDDKVVIYLPSLREWNSFGLDRGVLAFTLFRPDWRGHPQGPDILLNPSLPNGAKWSDRRRKTPPQTMNLIAIVLHELGHLIGLSHNLNRNSIMNILPDDVDKYDQIKPRSDDVEGICFLYPAQNPCKNGDKDCSVRHRCDGKVCRPVNPPISKLCKPCRSSADCGLKGICLATPDGPRCLQPCIKRGDYEVCPDGFHCAYNKSLGKKLCIPNFGHCPLYQCKSSSDCAGGICRGRGLNVCAAGLPFDYSRCNVLCSSDRSCGGFIYKCRSFLKSEKRCFLPCSEGGLCPFGYTCQRSGDGNFCMPNLEQNLCPCLRHEDCGFDRFCRNGVCVRLEGARLYEICSKNQPCAKGLDCVEFIHFRRCLKPCSSRSECGADEECATALGSKKYCLKRASVQQGGACDNYKRRCIYPLYCLSTNVHSPGVCVVKCKSSSDCRNGEYCSPKIPGLNFSICLCKGDSACRSGLSCRSLGLYSYRVCRCPDGGCKVKSCPRGKTLCESNGDKICVDVTKDPKHCGRCNRSCSAGEICFKGVCRACSCPSGKICCPDGSQLRCIDPMTDSNNCGGCGAACGDSVCVKGVCKSANGSRCGNGRCEGGENCSNCPGDCKCPGGEGKEGFCGDGFCQLSLGENCFSCPRDCVCPKGKTCYLGACIGESLICPANLRRKKCDPSGKNCSEICDSGCGCQTTSGDFPLLFVLFFSASVAFYFFRRLIPKPR